MSYHNHISHMFTLVPIEHITVTDTAIIRGEPAAHATLRLISKMNSKKTKNEVLRCTIYWVSWFLGG